MISYKAALRYLDKLEMFGMKLGLKNITALCKILGNPQDSYKVVHVAGTNGKGSVTAMCANILKEAGYKTGMYTSPHLQSFRERIQVNGSLITKEETVEVFEEVRKAADEMEKKGMKATYFEFTTAMALLYFKEKNCDFAVIEVGMGGRLDATNVVKPLVAVITNISLEHIQYLGSTKEKIAFEKAGVIKKETVTVIGEKDERIKQLLLSICNERNSEAVAVEKGYEGKISLAGEHQKGNAAIAVAAIKALQKSGIRIEDKIIENGIATAKWPGRLEKMQENPTVIIDAAHNPAGAKTAAGYMKKLGKEITLVIGIASDKDSKRMIKTLAPLAKKIIVTKAKHRGTECSILLKEAQKHCRNVEAVEDVKAAVSKAVNEANEEAVIVTGSIFMIGEARELWHREDSD